MQDTYISVFFVSKMFYIKKSGACAETPGMATNTSHQAKTTFEIKISLVLAGFTIWPCMPFAG
jgi:hypothetical protein